MADLLHASSTRRSRLVAIVFTAVAVVCTAVAARFSSVHAPVVYAAVPICAALWGAAALLTAYLLLSQFSVNGVRAFLVLGAAFAMTGLLTIPYLFFFPDLFRPLVVSVGTEQVSVVMWTVWHLTFPILVGTYYIVDRTLTARVIDTAEIRGNIVLTVVLVVAGALVITGLTNAERDVLPHLVVHGRFTTLWTHVYTPVIIVVNLVAALMVVALSKRPSRLQVWLAVALITAALDATLNALTTGRYTWPWYVGKIETLVTASVVLVVLLSEVAAMYRRLGTMAMLDPLTGLRNRRAIDDYLRWVIRSRRSDPSELSFLVLDVDYFKGFNDRYGHAAGDVALRRIANSIVESLHRDLDIAARFGGEEFVVLLPETGAVAAQHVAERIRRGVEGMQITHGASKVYSAVTVSIGVAYVDKGTRIDQTTLFSVADHALYMAKEKRNCTVVVRYAPDDPALMAAVPRVLAAGE
jgi:diguanylate cyclase (GGDEF)-like protein